MLFGRGSDRDNRKLPADTESSTPPKYERPKILLIDVKDESEEALQDAGYSVRQGTFGQPYEVEMRSQYTKVITSEILPPLAESDVVVVDLASPKPMSGPAGDYRVARGEPDWWASCARGVVDSRPMSMFERRDDFDGLLEHGSVFVLFAAPREIQDICFGRPSDLPWDNFDGNEVNCDNWSLLSALDSSELTITRQSGQDIRVLATPAIGPLLERHLDGASFACTVEAVGDWVGLVPLATNRYDRPVAGMLGAPENRGPGPGFILILPAVRDKAALLLDLLESWLPDVAPHLFPDVEGARWVERPEYELPGVLALKDEVAQIRRETQERIAELQTQIEQKRDEFWFVHALLRDTGDDLVEAVKKSLTVLGFTSVVDVDEEFDAEESDGFKREDLRIEDRSPWLLVEVKGIQSRPRDEDALQVSKYIAPCMKETDRTDIQGLCIINHQRHLPALDRDNENVFREDVVATAMKDDVALMTTWDLYRLVRGVLEYDWPRERVQDILYRPGRLVLTCIIKRAFL